MPFGLPDWFGTHIYLTILCATLMEGVGLPVPAEVLFIYAGLLVRQGRASLAGIVLAACAGNLTGSVVVYGVAYLGGRRLAHRIRRFTGLRSSVLRQVEAFFVQYGDAALFFSRFVGFLRAATIYSAGLTRLGPWRSLLWVTLGIVIWNAGWVWLAYRFGAGVPQLVQLVGTQIRNRPLAAGIVLLLAALFVWRWAQRRAPIRF